jgi:LemA protein
MSPFAIIAAAPAVIIIWVIFTYNRFVTLTKRSEEAWSDIDVQLKRRHDLIPNLIETVKGYATHERGVLEKVTEARAKAISAGSPHDKMQAENMLTDALKSLFAVAENYPMLRASENFLELQRELADTENKIQASRRFYNVNVRDLNIKLDHFPSNIIGKMFKFQKREFFEVEAPEERKPPTVKF